MAWREIYRPRLGLRITNMTCLGLWSMVALWDLFVSMSALRDINTGTHLSIGFFLLLFGFATYYYESWSIVLTAAGVVVRGPFSFDAFGWEEVQAVGAARESLMIRRDSSTIWKWIHLRNTTSMMSILKLSSI